MGITIKLSNPTEFVKLTMLDDRGQDCVEEFIGMNGGFVNYDFVPAPDCQYCSGWDYMATRDTVEWWRTRIQQEQEIAERTKAVLTTPEKWDRYIHALEGVFGLENEQEAALRLLDELEAEID